MNQKCIAFRATTQISNISNTASAIEQLAGVLLTKLIHFALLEQFNGNAHH